MKLKIFDGLILKRTVKFRAPVGIVFTGAFLCYTEECAILDHIFVLRKAYRAKAGHKAPGHREDI